MSKPIVTFLTGLPGSGKSTTASLLRDRCEQQGKRILFINDYPLLIQWAQEHRGQEDKVRWFIQDNDVENFDIIPTAYREMSAWIAYQIAQQIEGALSEYDVFVMECARGAGPDGMRDRYTEELFTPLMSRLGDNVSYVNVEMVVRDPSIVLERMRKRLLTEQNAAPPFVAEKYISPLEGIRSSFEEALNEGDFEVNQRIDNSDGLDETLLHVEGIVAIILALSARENITTIEGANKRKETE